MITMISSGGALAGRGGRPSVSATWRSVLVAGTSDTVRSTKPATTDGCLTRVAR
jgi:hypothetical protein